MKLPPRVTARPLAPLPIRMSLPDRRPVRKRLLPICLLKVQMTPRRRRFPKLLGAGSPQGPSGHPGGKRRRLWKLPYMARMRTLRRLRLLKSRLWNLPPLLRIRRRLMREKHPFQRIPLPQEEAPVDTASALRRTAVTHRSDTSILTIRSREEVETQEDREDVIWHEIHNAYRTRRILTGQLGGIEQLDNRKTVAVVDYKGFRIIIP